MLLVWQYQHITSLPIMLFGWLSLHTRTCGDHLSCCSCCCWMCRLIGQSHSSCLCQLVCLFDRYMDCSCGHSIVITVWLCPPYCIIWYLQGLIYCDLLLLRHCLCLGPLLADWCLLLWLWLLMALLIGWFLSSSTPLYQWAISPIRPGILILDPCSHPFGWHGGRWRQDGIGITVCTKWTNS